MQGITQPSLPILVNVYKFDSALFVATSSPKTSSLYTYPSTGGEKFLVFVTKLRRESRKYLFVGANIWHFSCLLAPTEVH